MLTLKRVVLGMIFALSMLEASGNAIARELIVCKDRAVKRGCDFDGKTSIQDAVDTARDGDTIFISSGNYSAYSYRDVPFLIHTIRGFVVVDGKSLTIRGERGTQLDGKTGPATTAIVFKNADVRLENIEIRGFRWGEQEDEIYDGHGLFAIDSRLQITDTVIAEFQKMGLVGRGDSRIVARRVQLIDGHVGVWMRESALLDLSDCVARNLEGSAVAAYASTMTSIRRCTIENARDEALYVNDQAVIRMLGSQLIDNKPVAARAVGAGVIQIDCSLVKGNEADAKADENARIWFGPHNLRSGDITPELASCVVE